MPLNKKEKVPSPAALTDPVLAPVAVAVEESQQEDSQSQQVLADHQGGEPPILSQILDIDGDLERALEPVLAQSAPNDAGEQKAPDPVHTGSVVPVPSMDDPILGPSEPVGANPSEEELLPFNKATCVFIQPCSQNTSKYKFRARARVVIKHVTVMYCCLDLPMDIKLTGS